MTSAVLNILLECIQNVAMCWVDTFYRFVFPMRMGFMLFAFIYDLNLDRLDT